MKIKIFGNSADSQKLFDLTSESLDSIGLSDFVSIEKTEDEAYKAELNISKEPAFCVEEEMLEFKDVIFEGIVPPREEIDSLLVSLIGGEAGHDCSSGCGGCSGSCG